MASIRQGDELHFTKPKIVHAHLPTLRTFIKTGNLCTKVNTTMSDLEFWLTDNGPQRIDKIQLLAARCMASFSRQAKDEMDWLRKVKSFGHIDFYKQNPLGSLGV